MPLRQNRRMLEALAQYRDQALEMLKAAREIGDKADISRLEANIMKLEADMQELEKGAAAGSC